ncbi:hypothetical protein P152DRAFT_460237 [Eremomyces bilateralis CBS 781.70]|uniref:Integral membrane protein n=1 Tax=Eremomyces bilateralis CBS 781.70 TaxID=1392243 RepID=A0A6G1FXY8_9PEZI|nr:uncharacterized protein P152DRAFT_460237 [Eremomyces bilateralis CBS 781.70]KAF1810536.1 hypothetical protein P152DRAFT_460237 [Eremomyces bilateralis CBS 781.70]
MNPTHQVNSDPNHPDEVQTTTFSPSTTTTTGPDGTVTQIYHDDPTSTTSPSRNTPSQHVSPMPSAQQTPPQVDSHALRPPPHSRDFATVPQSNLLQPEPARPQRSRRPSIRIRRMESGASLNRQPSNTAQTPAQSVAQLEHIPSDGSGGRIRSRSEPQRPSMELIGGPRNIAPAMECLREEEPHTSQPHPAYVPEYGIHRTQTAPDFQDDWAQREGIPPENLHAARHANQHWGGIRSATRGFFGGFNRRPQVDYPDNAVNENSVQLGEYGPEIVDYLDVVDPEVSTLTTLTNVQNSLFVPDLGGWLNRRPTYTVTRPAPGPPYQEPEPEGLPTISTEDISKMTTAERTQTRDTISSTLTDSRYAVLPHGMSLDGWGPGEKEELNDHVRHMLHSRRSRLKRSMKGFGQYVKRPLGFLVTLYATLITLFGLAWVLFLIGWIYLGDRQLYVVHIIDSVLVALFAVVGDGLAPFRAVDTYHMIFIAKYGHKTWELRNKRGLPELKNKNDFPTRQIGEPKPEPKPIDPNDDAAIADQKFKEQRHCDEREKPVEEAESTPRRDSDTDVENDAASIKTDLSSWEYTVLTPKEQQRLSHHQKKFARSHTFYKPHETPTHYAFPLRYLIAIVVLLDCHSLLQISLGACTWGIYYKVRPVAITTVILCFSIACNITAGVLISIGDRKTRKKDVRELLKRQKLTGEAVKVIEKKKEKERRRGESMDVERRGKSLDFGRRGKSVEVGRRGKSMDVRRKGEMSWDVEKSDGERVGAYEGT